MYLGNAVNAPADVAISDGRIAAVAEFIDLALADVALFRLEEADVTFYDVEMNPRAGNRRLVCTMTMVDGQLLPQRAERAPAIWAILPEHQRRVLDQG